LIDIKFGWNEASTLDFYSNLIFPLENY